MKNVILDTNIILDIALERIEFYEDARNVMLLINQKSIKSFVTATTITDIYYVLKNQKDISKQLDFCPDYSIL